MDLMGMKKATGWSAPHRLVVYPANRTTFGDDYSQQNQLSKCSFKYSAMSVVHH